MRITVFSCLVALAAAAATRADGPAAPRDEPYPLQVAVGGTVAICPTQTIICPAGAPICDDTSVAVPENDPKVGMVFKGLKPGSTLCSAGSTSGAGARRVYRVTVR